MSDLRALLREVRADIVRSDYSGLKPTLVKIDAALSEPAPEPYYECKICGEQVLFRRMVVQQITPAERIETGPYCKRCQQELLYPDSPSEVRDAARYVHQREMLIQWITQQYGNKAAEEAADYAMAAIERKGGANG